MHKTSIIDIYAALKAVARNDKNKTIAEQGKLIVISTTSNRNISDYYSTYPILQDIAELGSEMETQKNEAYIRDCLERFKLYLPVLKGQIDKNEGV